QGGRTGQGGQGGGQLSVGKGGRPKADPQLWGVRYAPYRPWDHRGCWDGRRWSLLGKRLGAARNGPDQAHGEARRRLHRRSKGHVGGGGEDAGCSLAQSESQI